MDSSVETLAERLRIHLLAWHGAMKLDGEEGEW